MLDGFGFGLQFILGEALVGGRNVSFLFRRYGVADGT